MLLNKIAALAGAALACGLFAAIPAASAKPHGNPHGGWGPAFAAAPQAPLLEGRSKGGDRGLHRGWSHSRHWGARRGRR